MKTVAKLLRGVMVIIYFYISSQYPEKTTQYAVSVCDNNNLSFVIDILVLYG